MTPSSSAGTLTTVRSVIHAIHDAGARVEYEIEKPCKPCICLARWGGVPLLATLLAAVVALGLAGATIVLWRDGTYDGRLAVLTLTLLGVIAYAYFSFRAARPAAWVVLSIHSNLGIPALHPEVENKTSRRLLAQMTLRLWEVNLEKYKDPATDESRVKVVDWESRPLSSFYRGEEWFPVEAGLSPTGVVPLKKHLERTEEGFKYDAMLIDLTVEWVEDSLLCEGGETRKIWLADLQKYDTSAVISQNKRKRLLAPLDDPYAPAQEVSA